MLDSLPYLATEANAPVDPAAWQQPGRRTRVLHRLFLSLVVGSVIGGIIAAVQLLEPTSTAGYIAAGLLILCFTLLFTWIASNFWLALIGVGRLIGYKRRRAREGATELPAESARTAVTVPVYNEDPAMVAGGLKAMLRSLDSLGALGRFDFFILSDSTDPDLWLEEERAWFELARDPAFRNHIFYRRRDENSERKSGNLKQFLENWGHEYRYMLVLDADSVMTGETMVELVRRMEADPELGLLQTWPRITGGRTLFARMHQYAAVLYGRLLACGMAALINPHGNYWGHNAIIRVDAFMSCCGLPRLPGKEPLGGEILSHDFVEAALLVRRGWKVELAADLDGSYEEGPPNIVQHVARDQRWCQGNLQHAWLLLARGMHPVSRMNFLTGILAYASSPVWLIFVLIAAVMVFSDQMLFSTGLVLVQREGGVWTLQTSALDSIMALALLGTTVTFILAPKLLGALIALAEGKENPLRLFVNVIAEMLLSILVAPTVMLRHSIFVSCLVFGRGVRWSPQQRDADRLTWLEAWRAFGTQTLLAAAVASTAIFWPSMMHLWLSPILLGLSVSVPLAVLTGRVPRHRPLLLTTAGDLAPPEILRRAAGYRGDFSARLGKTDPIRQLLDDPKLNQLHLYFLATDPNGSPGSGVGAKLDGGLLARAQHRPTALSKSERAILLTSPSALRRLQVERFSKAAGGTGEDKDMAEGEKMIRQSKGVEISQKCPTEIPTWEGTDCSSLDGEREGSARLRFTGKGREKLREWITRITGSRQKPSSLCDGLGREPDRGGGPRPGMPSPSPRSAREGRYDPELSRLSFSDAAQCAYRPVPEAFYPRRGDSGGY